MSLAAQLGKAPSFGGLLPSGVGPIPYIGSAPPTGWVFAAGRTIGNAASGATERANADTLDLFTLLWSSMSNTEAPVSGGRGASAAADFAANKTIVVPDMRGRVAAGRDNMGGTAANRLTTGGSGVNGTTLGATGGAETHTLTSAQMPAHTHNTGATISGRNTSTGGGETIVYAGSTYTGTSAGGDGAHNNTQPTLVVNAIIKL